MKKTLCIILALAMVIGLCACGGNNGGGNTGTADNYDKYAEQYGTIDGLYRSVVFATRIDIEHLEPTAGTGTPKNEFYWNLYETLFDFNQDNELVSDLAKSYDVVNEGLSWDIHLYETIKDSKGNAITAEDVATSFQWLVDAGEALKYENVKDWEVVDDYTFRINWVNKPASINDYEFPLCRTYIYDSQYKGSDFAKDVVGTGNYIVADFVTGNHLTIWANKDYWALNTDEDVSNRLNLHSATVQQITWEVIQESATAEVALEKGTIDYCDYINQKASVEKFKTEYADKYNVETETAQSYSFMQLNMDSSNVFVDDENLRLAVFYALDSHAIAQVMGASYVACLTLGHAGFSDFNEDWEEELKYYCGEADTEKAKEYLGKSKYNGQDFAIMCKSSEVDKNAAQSIMAQLMAVGITCHLEAVDPTIFQTSSSDPSAWDMLLFSDMGGTTLANTLGLPLGDKNTNADGTDKWSLNFIRDTKMVELLAAAQADDTKGDETLKAFIDYVLSNGYIYPIAYSSTNYIYSKKITQLYRRETTVTPAACTYEGQTPKEEKVTSVTPAAFDKSLAGKYTYSEAPKFGDGMNEFTLTLNEDGTYRLDNKNGAGEEVYTEGKWTSDGNRVSLSAAKVQGAMDRLLVDWVDDMNNPAPTFEVDKAKGTMTPVIVANVADFAGTYTYSEAASFGNKNHDFTLTLKEDGSYKLECNNSVGENIWTEGTFEIDADGNVALSASKVQGDMDKLLNSGWADADNPAPVFTVDKEKGTMVPVGLETTEKEEESTAAEGDVPKIVDALSDNDAFHTFKYVENSDYGTFTWYVMKNDTEGMVIVAVHNPNLGTSDGDAVWHFKNVTEDKGVLTLDGLEDGDKSLPTVGSQWTDKDNFIQQWQITSADAIQPANASSESETKAASGTVTPKIVEALAGNEAFETFTYVEEGTPAGDVTWYLLKNDSEGMVIVACHNELLGTSDGDAVWHFRKVSEDKGLLTLDGLEDGDKSLPTMGNQWSDTTNLIQKWQITGQGAVQPAGK